MMTFWVAVCLVSFGCTCVGSAGSEGQAVHPKAGLKNCKVFFFSPPISIKVFLLKYFFFFFLLARYLCVLIWPYNFNARIAARHYHTWFNVIIFLVKNNRW